MGDATPQSKCKKQHRKKDIILATATTDRNRKRRMAKEARRQERKREHLVAWGARKGVHGVEPNLIRAAVRGE